MKEAEAVAWLGEIWQATTVTGQPWAVPAVVRFVLKPQAGEVPIVPPTF